MRQPDRHRGRVAVVTGAGSGIGRATAARLAAEGAQVACVDIDGERARTTAKEIGDGSSAAAFAADVRDRAAVQEALDGTVERLGPLSYLVNNAGLVTMSGLESLTEEEWDLVVDVNLKGTFLVTKLAAAYLRRGPSPAVVNLSTVESEVVVSSDGSCQPHYNASKGGVRMLSKALAVELARDGVRVNTVAPGPVQTGFIPGVDPDDPQVPEAVLDRLLVRRLGQPDDVAAAISFLLSDDAAYVTGTQLVVDGGWLAR